MEGRFGEAGLVSAYERGNGTQVVVTMLVVHVVAGKEERFAAPKTTGQGRSRGPGSLEVLHCRAGEMEPATYIISEQRETTRVRLSLVPSTQIE